MVIERGDQMIAKLSHIIADFFVQKKVVSEEQREIYEYGFELSISSIIGILIILTIGLISRRFWESIVFYIVFCFTRLFTGGYHAPNHIFCKIIFGGVLLAVLAADWFLKGIYNRNIGLICFYKTSALYTKFPTFV